MAKAPALAVVMRPHHEEPDGDELEHEDGEDGDYAEGLENATKAFFEAGSEGDFAKAAKAYKLMHKLCTEAEEEGEEEEGEGEEE
ncbi:MAG TPA: hypothetical protein VF219_19500 [Vicinamibacterales bacterium]